MMTPAAMAIATITVMLWILWSDSIRRHRPSQIVYTVRIALFLVVSAVQVLNMVRYPGIYDASSRAVTILAVAIGVGGAVYFGRKLVRRSGTPQ